MNRLISFLILCLFSMPQLNAQVIIKGKLGNLPGEISKIAVDYWLEDRWHELDIIQLTPEKTFQKRISGKYGQTRLRLWGQPTRWLDFIFPQNPATDSVIDFGNIDYAYINANPANLRGGENEAYYSLLTANKKYRLQRDSLSQSDSLPGATKERLKTNMETARSFMNARCREISANHKGTITGDIVAKLLYVPEKSDFPDEKDISKLTQTDFERDYLLDLLPVNDSRVLFHNGLIRALNVYTSKFCETDSSNYINTIMGIRKGNEKVDTWLFKYLLQTLVNYKDDNGLTYLLKWYSNGCSMEELNKDQSTSILLTSLKNCETGKKAYNLSLPDINGINTSLSGLAAKSKLTLLLFWRTDCSHCLEFEPELEDLYKKYASAGLEVIGISMDQDESTWKKYLAAHPAKWPNLRPNLMDQRVQLITHYPVPGTPALIAVDKNFIVKNRMVIRNNIEDYIKEALTR